MNTSDVTTATAPVHAAAPGIVLVARVGYAAKGLVYLVIGWLAGLYQVATARYRRTRAV